MNQRIQNLAEQSNAWFPEGYPSAEGGDEAWKNLVIFEKTDLEKFAELIVAQLVSKLEVEGSDIYHNESNNYGCITVKYFVPGNPNDMIGEETQADFRHGRAGTGRYRLNDKFIKFLMDNHLGVSHE